MRDITVASVQFTHAAGDKQANFKTMEGFIEAAVAQNVKMLVFPEMCITGYWHVRNLSKEAIDELAERIPEGPSTQRLRHLAKANGVSIGAGLIEKSISGHYYNSYVVAMSDGSYACHRKLHCFINEHFSNGDEFTVFDTPHGCTCGILICYDNNLIENVRITALQGAEILLAPHQTGGCLSQSPHAMGLIDTALWAIRDSDPQAIEAEFKGPKGRGWLMRWLPARAHDNGLFVLFSNGVGLDDGEVRTGNAMILDPYGRILNETWAAGDAMVVADLEAELQEISTGRRWMRGRRPELYASLAKRTGKELDPRTARFS
jgi:predicted amidohydrolase